MIFGLLLIFSTIIPYVVIRDSIGNAVDSRFALEANMGVAIFISSLIFLLYYKNIISKRISQIFIAVIILLGVGICNTVVKIYDNDWQNQRSFWWQFIWRVPDLKKGTFLIIDSQREEVFTGEFSPWTDTELYAPFNMLYSTSKGKDGIASNAVMPDLILKKMFRNYNRKGYFFENNDLALVQAKMNIYNDIMRFNPKDIVVASFHDGVLAMNGEIDFSYVKKRINLNPYIVNSSPDAIIIDTKRLFPLRWIMGKEPQEVVNHMLSYNIQTVLLDRHLMIKDWRYYYQIAKVLLLKKDFVGIAKLCDNVNPDDYFIFPSVMPETLIPFITALYITQDYTKGRALILQWAVYSNGSLPLALEMKKYISDLGEYPESVNRLDKDIKRIFHN
ncbi:MAG: hypothetical protein HQK93_00580 [Nitrospirae bacterium]|nr:hypothetical protein [Nitrospirota bacterium]